MLFSYILSYSSAYYVLGMRIVVIRSLIPRVSITSFRGFPITNGQPYPCH